MIVIISLAGSGFFPLFWYLVYSQSLFELFSGSDTSTSGSKISRAVTPPVLVCLRSKSQSIIFNYQTTVYTKALYFKRNKNEMLNHADSRRLTYFSEIFSCLTLHFTFKLGVRPEVPKFGSVASSRSINESTLDLGSTNPGNPLQRNFDK